MQANGKKGSSIRGTAAGKGGFNREGRRWDLVEVGKKKLPVREPKATPKKKVFDNQRGGDSPSRKRKEYTPGKKGLAGVSELPSGSSHPQKVIT